MDELYEQLTRHWMVGCLSRKLGRHPLAVTILGIPLVLYRCAGRVVAAEDRCPHRNAPLSKGRIIRDQLQCPYHGWCFDAQGHCVAAPGAHNAVLPEVSLRSWRAVERDGYVWIAHPNAGQEPVVYRPAMADDGRYRTLQFCTAIPSNLPDALENLLDGTHTPYVHSGLVRSPEATQEFTATVHRHDAMVEIEYRGEPRQHGWISRLFEPEREASFGRYIAPCTAELEYRSRRRTELLVVAHFVPATQQDLRVFLKAYVPAGWLPAGVRAAIVRPFFSRVFQQDLRILRLQQQNTLRFGGPAYTRWSADLMRPWIDAWLRDGQFPMQPEGPLEFRFSL